MFPCCKKSLANRWILAKSIPLNSADSQYIRHLHYMDFNFSQCSIVAKTHASCVLGNVIFCTYVFKNVYFSIYTCIYIYPY